MVQAENEANKAVGGNEMVNDYWKWLKSYESYDMINGPWIVVLTLFQLNLRIKSLKNQLDISESELDLAQTEKRKIQEENLDKDKEIQVRT